MVTLAAMLPHPQPCWVMVVVESPGAGRGYFACSGLPVPTAHGVCGGQCRIPLDARGADAIDRPPLTVLVLALLAALR